jgi:hypothetical protein
MGTALAWTETLIACLLLLALATACSARLRRRWLRWLLPSLVCWLPGLFGLALAVPSAILMQEAPIHRWLFYYTLSWAVTLVVAGVTVYRRGLRPCRDEGYQEEGMQPAAIVWPRTKLAIATAAAFLLCAMTLWNMTLAAQNKFAAARAEAGALALSVAGSHPPDSQNAALVYEKAFKFMADGAGVPEPSDDADEDEVRTYLEKRETALRLLRQAASLPDCRFMYADAIPEPAPLMHTLAAMRSGARLLALDARFQAAQGRADTALADVSALFGLSRHAGGRPLLTQALVAMAIGAHGHLTLQTVLAECDPSEEDLAGLIDEVYSYWRLYRRSMRMEQAFSLSQFATELESIRGAFFILPELSGYRSMMAELDGVLALPYREAREAMGLLETQALAGRWGILQELLYPALGRAAVASVRAEARRRLDNLAVAATAHRIRHGKFPATPGDLVPEFLMIFPKDPFDGEPMRMANTPEGILFYSIADDMTDNAGAEWDREAETGDLTFRLRTPSPD